MGSAAKVSSQPISTSVSGSTSYLLAGEKAGSKLTKAQQLNVPILDEAALRERIGVRNETLGTCVDRLLASGRLIRTPDGLVVPVPPSADRRERNGP